MRSRRAGAMLILLAFLAFVSLGLPDTLLGVAWPSIRATFGRPVDSLGLLAGCAMAGYLASSFFAGGLIDRAGVAPLLIGSSAIVAASLAAYASSPIWPGLLLAALLAGLGAGAIDAGINTFAAGAFSPRVVNWLHGCWGIGATVGPAIMTATLAAHHTWRAGYAIVAAIIAALALVFVATRRLWRIDRADVAAAPPPPATISRTFAEPVVRWQLAFFFAYCAVEAGAGAWLATLLAESRGHSLPAAGTAVSLYWGALTVGRFAFGQAAATLGAPMVLRVGMIGALVGITLLAPGLPRGATVAGILLLGLSLAPLFPTMISQTPLRVGPRFAARTVGFQVAAAGLGVACGPAIIGIVARRTTIEALAPLLLAGAVALPLLDARARRLAARTPPTEEPRCPTA